MTKDAVLLAGSLGLGHEMMARSCAGLLELSGWRTRRLDSMSLLGRGSGRASERLFGRLVSLPGLYDGLHFAHLRTGSRLANLMDRAASARLVPSLRAELERRPADLVISVLATDTFLGERLRRLTPGPCSPTSAPAGTTSRQAATAGSAATSASSKPSASR